MSDQAKVTLSGKIKTIFPSEIYGNFEKRVMWLDEQTDKYPQTWPIEFTQNDCNVLDSFKEGDLVECHINLRGRHSEKNGKEYCFGSFQCWRIRRVGAEQPAQEAAPAATDYSAVGSADDLPF